MRILFLDQYGEVGGAQQCLLDLMPAVIAQRWTPFAACPPDGPLTAKLEALGVACTGLACGNYSMGAKSARDTVRYAARLPAMSRVIGRLIKQNRIDLIYVNGPRVLAPAAWAAVPLVFHCHNRLAGAALELTGRLLRYAGASVVSSSRFTVEPLERYIRPLRARVIYNGVAAAAELPMRCADGTPRLGVVGRIDANKGQDVFLQAARLLHGCNFVICGAPLFSDAAAREYEARLRELADGLPVEFTGYREDAVRIIAGLDVLVVPSMIAEATTRVVLEAFANGVPVVAFATGGIPEVIEHGVNGFLVTDRTPQALAAALEDALGDRPRLRQIAATAHKHWQTRFRIERYQSEIVEAICEASLRQ